MVCRLNGRQRLVLAAKTQVPLSDDKKGKRESVTAWRAAGLYASDGEVDGKFGTLQMSVNGKSPDVFTDWEGRWVILSGTGDLSTLHEQGTWWGPGAPDVGEWGDIYYAGRVHFEPE